MSSPIYKVYRGKEYMGCAKEPEAAGVMASFYGEGATIRYGHSHILWTEGKPGVGDGYGSESYDTVATVVAGRIHALPHREQASGRIRIGQ